MAKTRVVRVPGPYAVGANPQEAADESTGGDQVFVVGIGSGVVIPVTPPLVTALDTLADTPVTSAAAALPALAAGPNGIAVDADLNNGSVIVRIASGTVSATEGRRLTAGASLNFAVQNANQLNVITEGAVSGKVQVSQT
jgi:hypothetical protein